MGYKENLEIINCSRLNQQMSMHFLHAIKNGNRPLILVSDKGVARKVYSYLTDRTKAVFYGIDDLERQGFYIDTFFNASDVDGFTSIGILTWEEQISHLNQLAKKFAGDVPTLITRRDLTEYSKEHDYWGEVQNIDNVPTYPKTKQLLQDDDIRKMFIDTFMIAEKEIDIVCPWINQNVVNDKLISLMDEALCRGVKIKIMYGIGDGEDERSSTSEETVEMLKRRFEIDGENLSFKRGNTHVKLLLCDDKYWMLGSYNFLSFAGDYKGNDLRGEAVTFDVDTKAIVQSRLQFFSW
ncbi:MAG: phospholipase D-like domain-containing protein [Eubacteriales bacterium]|nr:phospholipase D-like domain-containing protein [Eubacteriales bacterium]